MTSLALFLLMTAGAVLILALPFLRRQTAPDRRHFDLTFYRDQLAELERDRERGIIDDEAARSARLEIQRRILAVAAGDDLPVFDDRAAMSKHALATAVLILVVPLVSGLLYVKLGRPDMPDMPLAARDTPDQQLSEQESLLANIEQMEKHLETTPENGGVWTALGRARLRAGRYQAAVEAFEKGMAFSPGDPGIEAELGEAMVYAAGGQVAPAAVAHFKAMLETSPNEPRSRYYLGLALAQEGEVDAAIEGWSHLLEVSPSDAPWRPQIVAAVKSVLEGAGRPAEEVVAGLPAGTVPAGEGVTSRQAVLEALPPEARNEQIKGMVEGLAARLEDQSDDLEGWVMLGRSRMVLGEPDAAKDAFERALDLAPDQPDVLLAYASALLQPSATPGGDPVVGGEAADLYRKVADLAPDNPEPHWLLGLAAMQAGDKEKAIGHWRDLLGLIDEASEDHHLVEARIAALASDEPAANTAAGAAPSLSEPAPPDAETGRAETKVAPANGSDPQPSAEDRAEMAALSPDKRNERIRAMVDGLAARLEDDPDDVDGWLRLAQSRMVLGEPEAAKEAYGRAMAVEPDSPAVLRAYASSLLGDVDPETRSPTVNDEAEALYRKLADLKPDDPEAHWYLGLAAAQKGTIEEAKAHWRRVLDLLGPDHPNYAAIQSSLDEVETRTQ
jgi:cytochrome c-type biogenesis protein CcmH